MLKRFDNHRRSNSRSPVCSGWIFVRTGSRDETVEESGVSHFLEHMLFKGTKSAMQRRSTKISTKSAPITMRLPVKKTLCFMHQPCPSTIKMQQRFSLIFFALPYEVPTLKWKKVIIEEIGMYEDNPGWMVLITHASYFLLITLWATAYSEQPKASSI